ncbi:MAG TPA: SDR family NAD(P)-dependent oxidoreductase, partial [Candidatus Thermoplasmatota archaeon]|nr:SDR family NAD(P)-dependent oxidoreductase [Candidatus Thermoplasmatota archaeon]
MWDGKGKVALVTGATSGIGQAIATGLAAAGTHVTILARNPQKARATIERIRAKAPNAKVEVLEGDIASQASVRAAAAKFAAKHSKLDILVNCAGVFLPTRTLTDDGVETTFATNYLGHFQLTNLLLPKLKKASPSRIVTVASRYGGAKVDFEDLMVEKRKFSYLKAVPASKLAQVLFTQELAERLEG